MRPTGATDKAFLFRVFCSAQEGKFGSLSLPAVEKEQLLRMEFTAQLGQYHDQYPDADFNLLIVDDIPVGNFYAQYGPEEFVLIDITLLPEQRNSGVGTQLVRDLIAKANAARKPLHAHVLKANPAWRLWQRLGFRWVEDDGVYLRIEVPVVDP